MKAKKINTITVAVINYQHAMTSSILGIVDILEIVNKFCLTNETPYKFRTTIINASDNIINFNKRVVFDSISLNIKDNFDLVIVPPLIDLEHKFDTDKNLLKWLNKMHVKGSYICSVCIGSYVLAQAGLLDGKKATSHWVIEQKLRSDFPSVDLDIDKIVVEDKNIITAGGVTAYIDLCLYIVRKFISMEVAYVCANYLGVDAGRTSQQHYKNLSSIAAHNDNDIQNLIDWINKNYSKSITTRHMAKKISVSERTLIRRFKKSIGELPNNYLQKIRVQKAKQMLINSNDSFEYITHLVGYTNTSSFRSLFKNMTGLNPGTYREYFMVK
jgi:transcriptional regulator GlxA family with amidase domain